MVTETTPTGGASSLCPEEMSGPSSATSGFVAGPGGADGDSKLYRRPGRRPTPQTPARDDRPRAIVRAVGRRMNTSPATHVAPPHLPSSSERLVTSSPPVFCRHRRVVRCPFVLVSAQQARCLEIHSVPPPHHHSMPFRTSGLAN